MRNKYFGILILLSFVCAKASALSASADIQSTKDSSMILGKAVGDFGKFDDVSEDEVMKATTAFINDYPTH